MADNSVNTIVNIPATTANEASNEPTKMTLVKIDFMIHGIQTIIEIFLCIKSI